MGDVGQQLAVALGLVATVVGIVGALSQVTTAALLRRQVAFYRDVVQSKQQTATQAAVAASMRDRALALIVARQAVPLRLPSLSRFVDRMVAVERGTPLRGGLARSGPGRARVRVTGRHGGGRLQ